MSPRKPVFVVFEGLDGSGKTTAARRTADLLGAAFLTTPSPELRRYRGEIIAGFKGCQEAAQFFYLATVFAASREIAGILEAKRSVVLDRYFLSTQAYAEFRGSKLDLDHVGDGLLQPDLTVFLDAPLEIRRARLVGRGETSAEDRETLAPKADAELRRRHLNRSTLGVVRRLLQIDTSMSGPDGISAQVARAIQCR